VPEDRVVLLVGATSGMGLASAMEFTRRGCRLVLAARSHEALSAAADECRAAGAPRVDTVAADVGRHPEVDAIVGRALELHERIDVAVLTAASMAYGTVAAVPVESSSRWCGPACSAPRTSPARYCPYCTGRGAAR
jgi:NAD(P)-dependent dehydrogenase (short-subunit alcohol dehydrogenase family)